MLARLAQLILRRRRLVLASALIFFVAAGAFGGNVASTLSAGGFEDPGAESTIADDALLSEFNRGAPNVILLVEATSGDAADDATTKAGLAVTKHLQDTGVKDVISYWTLGKYPELASAGGDKALVLGRIPGDQNEVNTRAEELVPELDALDNDVVQVEVGGYGPVFEEVGRTIEQDLLRAEMIAIPITIVLLLLVFRGVIAAALPLGIGVLSIVGTFFVLRVLTEITEVSVYALNLTTAMGLGLAIDYSLFIVSRYREELANGFEPDDALVRTLRTAGRTVAFSATTVAASLLALLVFPIAFLKSFAYAGVAVASLAGIFSVVVLPAMLAVLGRRIDSLALRRRAPKPVEEGFWHRAALFVMKRPVPIATIAIAILFLLGSPFLGIKLGLPDDRVQPEDAETRVVHDAIREEFTAEEAGKLTLIARDVDSPTDHIPEITALAGQLAALDGVSEVRSLGGVYVDGEQTAPPGDALLGFANDDGATFVEVVPSIEPFSTEGEALVKQIRAIETPFEFDVTGQSAQLVDSKAGLFAMMPLAIAIIAVITFVVLFMMFGSVIIPLKAVVLNLLSLSATFGAMVWIFQEGNFADTLRFTPGDIDASTPILMFCVAFALSMDFEVFLLSRIKEEHDRGAENTTAVAAGLEHTGRIVTAAALLISVVFLAFSTSDIRFIKLFGIGLALAVLMDAYLIRGALVPAFMRLAGEWNWWAPGPLRRFHDRYGISEHVVLDDTPLVPRERSRVLAAPGQTTLAFAITVVLTAGIVAALAS